MAKKTYFATRNIDFGTDLKDQKRYVHGDPIELEDKTAEELLACGAVSEKAPKGGEEAEPGNVIEGSKPAAPKAGGRKGKK